MRQYHMNIDGREVRTDRILEVVNPATGEVFAHCSRADESHVDLAVATARAAFPSWSTLPVEQRQEKMLEVALALEQRTAEFAALLTQEQGKPTIDAQHEVGATVALLRAYAMMRLTDEVVRDNEVERIVKQRTPLGVIAAIAPWNVPLALLAMKLAPAWITGNTVVAKPAPTTPLATLLFAELANDILPPGVFNIIIDDNDLGDTLSAHPGVAKIAFTGSTETGKKVMASAATSIKRLTLELGGNDPAIVLDDADVKTVARLIFNAAMVNAGQICVAAKRVYAPRALYDELCSELAQIANETVVGDGSQQGTTIGPVQNRQQFEKLKGFLADAHANGTVIAGGEIREPGFFVQPTIVRDIPDDSRLVREEQFGPVLPVLVYDSIDELIARVNDFDVALGGSIWTSNPERGAELASRIDGGVIWVNKHFDMPFDVPFGGAKQSGLGAELGQESLEEYTQRKVINIAKGSLAPA